MSPRRPRRQRSGCSRAGLRDRRRGAEPGPDQGDAAPPRPAGRALPPADGRRSRLARRPRRRGLRQPGGRPWLTWGREVHGARPPRLPRRAGGDRPQLHGDRAGQGDDRRILLIDCGLMFPGPDLHGIDLVLPDFTYLRENAERIEALVATHGHEDHVGGIQFLLREVSFPIYGSALTLGLARNRIEEAGLLGRPSCNPCRRRRAATSGRSTSSSSPSPTACPTPTPSPSTRRRA